MRAASLKLGTVLVVLTVVALVVAGTGRTPAAAEAGAAAARTERGGVEADAGPTLTSIGPLTFGPDGTLFAADTQAATIYALDVSRVAPGAPGAQGIDAIDQKIAAMLGTEPREIAVTDLVVHPKTRNAYISVMRGQGAAARPALLRVDGAGKVDLVAFEGMKYTKVALPNPPNASEGPRNPRPQSVTDMAFIDGKLFVAGLSNEEFASKLRSIPYPFAAADNGTSVEIFHGNHGQFETRSPVYTFVPYKIDNQPHLIAGYLCTPLVKFPIANLKPGTKVLCTTIAELGNRNRPLDMIVYKKDGKEFLLMSNNSRGVMKIPTETFGTAGAITSRVETPTGGVAYETIAALKGVEQLDLLDDKQTLLLSRTEAGGLNLQTVALP
jgi:hypothetical protein